MKRKRRATKAQLRALKKARAAKRRKHAGEGVVRRAKTGRFSKRAKHIAGRVSGEARRRRRGKKRRRGAREAAPPRTKRNRRATKAQKRYLRAARKAKKRKNTSSQKELLAAIRGLKQYGPRRKKRKKGKGRRRKTTKRLTKRTKRASLRKASTRAGMSRRSAKKRKSMARKRKKSGRRRKGHRRATKKQLRALGKARAARRRNLRRGRGRRHRVKGYVARRRKSRWRVPSHLSREARRRRHAHAFDNPMDGIEFGIALFTGLIGYGAMSFGRRYLAAHRPEASGSLSGVMAMELAPMDWKQWLLGTFLTVVPTVGGHFIKNKPLRSVVQGFGFGAGIATAGKALDDGIAMLAKKSELGALLYAPEVSAQAYTQPQKTGTGALPEGVCPTCERSDGLGKCCRSSYAGAPNRMDVRDNPPSVPPAQAQPPIQGPPAISNNNPMTPRDIPVPPAPPPPPQITGPQTPTFTPQVPIGQVAPSPVPAQPLPQVPIVGVRGFPNMPTMPNLNWGHQGDN